jgi:threonine dehydratase
MLELRPPSPQDVADARHRIAGTALRTPLVRLDVDLPFELWIKLENLQPIGSFKLRGALNAMRALSPERLSSGVYTASAGNMAQGVAWGAREMGVTCTVLVPDRAPQTKLDAIARLGAKIVKLSYADWWNVLVENGYPGMAGQFIHPVSNQNVLAGNATIGSEIIEDVGRDIAAVFVPYGGGGLSAGIAAVMKESTDTRVYGCEVETAAPFSASLKANAPVSIEHIPSFIDGIGGRSVLAEMWPLTSTLLGGSLVMTVAQTAAAVRTLVTRGRVVAEGAAATAVAAALNNGAALVPAKSRCVAVVSGGNIDRDVLRRILADEI